MSSSQDSSDSFFSESETEKLNSMSACKVTPKRNLVLSLLAYKHSGHLLMNTPKPPFKVTADTMMDVKMSDLQKTVQLCLSGLRVSLPQEGNRKAILTQCKPCNSRHKGGFCLFVRQMLSKP